MVIDPIGDMIVRMKNAGAAKLPTFTLSYSKIKNEIAKLLVKEGYLKSAKEIGGGGEGKDRKRKELELEIVYVAEGKAGRKHPKWNDVSRVSKVSKRVYGGVGDLRPVRQGYGIAVLTTTKGIMTDKEAKKAGVGGEILFKIW